MHAHPVCERLFVWPALCCTSEGCNMWACSNMPGQASELSETFETMVTHTSHQHIGKSIDKQRRGEGIERVNEEEEVNL